MQPTIQLREGPVAWTQVLNASTASTLFPTSTAAGGVVMAGPVTHKLHVAVEVNSTAGTSCTVAVLGLAPAGQLGTVSTWTWLANMNGGSSIAGNTSKWSDSTTHVMLVETFTLPPEAYQRYATLVVQGSTNVVSTWVGVSRP